MTITYSQLALNWQPEAKRDGLFTLVTIASLLATLLLSLVVTFVDVPEKDREARVVVPERIANFILEKKDKPKLKKVIKKRIKKIELKPVVKPKVKKLPKKKIIQKPLTKQQKKSRKKAAESGLLALGNELADLMDTDDLNAMLGSQVKHTKGAEKKAIYNKSLLTENVSKGSGGVNSNQYTNRVNSTQLTVQQLTQVKQSLALSKSESTVRDKKRKKKSRTGGIRAEDGISIIFDKNKSKLYSIYNKARRKNPSLMGKIVLAITISPAGKVTKIKVLSSELNDAKLERRLLGRIKLFNFGAQNVETITVTYPIEFLPS